VIASGATRINDAMFMAAPETTEAQLVAAIDATMWRAEYRPVLALEPGEAGEP
jgi:hypothetical protein